MTKKIRIAELEAATSIPPWRNRRIQVQTLVGLVVTALLFPVGLFIVYPQVNLWRNNRILHLAEQYLHKEDYRSSYLLLEQFVRKTPTNFTARRMLANVCEKLGSEQALTEWESLMIAEPTNPANYAGYATAALKFGQIGRLPGVLKTLQALAPESGEFHRLAAGSALAHGDLVALGKHLTFLASIEPQNPLTRFSLALLQLNSSHLSEVAQARRTMAEFAQSDGLRIRATLALINDSSRRWPDEKSTARRYTLLADELKLRGPSTGPTPRYVMMQDYSLPTAGLPALISHMVAQPELTANDAVMLAQWMLQIGQGRDALYWLDTLDEPLRITGIVRQSMASCAAALESWPRLELLVTGGAWGPVPVEAVKLAFGARALRASHNDSKAGSQWNGAIRLCEQSLPGLRMLQRLAQIWQWQDKQVQVLWILVRQFPADESAWRALIRLAQAEEDSPELWRIYQAWAQAVPASPAVQGERVLFGLLARPDESGLGAQAAELFLRHPEIPVCRVAQALALWRANQPVEALEIAEGAPLNFELNPRFALVRGVILSTLGRAAESERMFALTQGAKLLPAERALMGPARKTGN